MDVQADSETKVGNSTTDEVGQQDEDMGMLDDPECLMMIGLMGCAPTRSFRREHRRGYRKLVSEIYSPPRVTRALSAFPGHPLAPGFALDITCTDHEDGMPWDFDVREKRDKARRLLREQRPRFLVGSPMCTAWCTWQRLNAQKRDPDLARRELIRARLHLDFVMELYREQIEAGVFFLHEHPRAASLWWEPAVQEILKIPEVDLVTDDHRQLGAQVLYGYNKGKPVRKRTSFMNNV